MARPKKGSALIIVSLRKAALEVGKALCVENGLSDNESERRTPQVLAVPISGAQGSMHDCNAIGVAAAPAAAAPAAAAPAVAVDTLDDEQALAAAAAAAEAAVDEQDDDGDAGGAMQTEGSEDPLPEVIFRPPLGVEMTPEQREMAVARRVSYNPASKLSSSRQL